MSREGARLLPGSRGTSIPGGEKKERVLLNVIQKKWGLRERQKSKKEEICIHITLEGGRRERVDRRA